LGKLPRATVIEGPEIWEKRVAPTKAGNGEIAKLKPLFLADMDGEKFLGLFFFLVIVRKIFLNPFFNEYGSKNVFSGGNRR
jgi:hypothetical protein